MPASLLMVGVDWYGPFFDLNAARRLGEREGLGEYLYLAYEPESTGKRSYVGLSSQTSRLSSSHHVIGKWQTRAFELWIGVIASQGEPGRRPSDSYEVHSAVLHFAEHMTAFFVQTSENNRKRRNPPDRSGVLINRWFGIEENWPRHKRRPHPNWPDLIEFEVGELARVVWFGRAVDKYDADGIYGLKRLENY